MYGNQHPRPSVISETSMTPAAIAQVITPCPSSQDKKTPKHGRGKGEDPNDAGEPDEVQKKKKLTNQSRGVLALVPASLESAPTCTNLAMQGHHEGWQDAPGDPRLAEDLQEELAPALFITASKSVALNRLGPVCHQAREDGRCGQRRPRGFVTSP